MTINDILECVDDASRIAGDRMRHGCGDFTETMRKHAEVNVMLRAGTRSGCGWAQFDDPVKEAIRLRRGDDDEMIVQGPLVLEIRNKAERDHLDLGELGIALMTLGWNALKVLPAELQEVVLRERGCVATSRPSKALSA